MSELLIYILLGILLIIVLVILQIRIYIQRRKEASQEWVVKHEKINGELAQLDESLTKLVQLSKLNHIISVKSRMYSEQILYPEYHRKAQAMAVSLPIYETDLAYLMKIPGIGEAKAERLIKKFGSILEIQKAPIQKLQEVDQIGPQLAETIKNHLET